MALASQHCDDDDILGVIAGASFIAITVGLLRLWTGGGTAPPHHP